MKVEPAPKMNGSAFALTLAALISLFGCSSNQTNPSSSDEAGGPTADHIEIVQGDAQSAAVATNVAVAPQIRVLDIMGAPIANIAVNFTVVAGGGSISSGTAVTDGSGLASVSWTMGTVSGSQSILVERASVALPGIPASVTFNATANPGPATQLVFSTAPVASVEQLENFSMQPVVQI